MLIVVLLVVPDALADVLIGPQGVRGVERVYAYGISLLIEHRDGLHAALVDFVEAAGDFGGLDMQLFGQFVPQGAETVLDLGLFQEIVGILVRDTGAFGGLMTVQIDEKLLTEAVHESIVAQYLSRLRCHGIVRSYLDGHRARGLSVLIRTEQRRPALSRKKTDQP